MNKKEKEHEKEEKEEKNPQPESPDVEESGFTALDDDIILGTRS